MNKAKRITVAGFGGQGVMMIGQMLAYAGNEADLNSLWFPSYGPETRGGTANCSVTISPVLINSPVFSKADTLIIMNKPSLTKFWDKIEKGGDLIYNSSLIIDEVKRDDCRVFGIPAVDLALELGNIKVANMIVFGAYMYLNPDFSDEIIQKVLTKILGQGKQHLVDINVKAIQIGKDYISKLVN
ncbi:MAG: 2-oxoacid:acceptor oxidoreductase family protein [Bacilli bacterium]